MRADNFLQALTTETDESENVEVLAAQFLQKVELIASLHDDVLVNVEHAQRR